MTFVLCNIRSAWNVGSAFRTAECLGAKIILVGYTPRPVNANLKLITKTAIGAEKNVIWSEANTAEEVFEKNSNSYHIASEICSESKNVYDFLQSIQFSENNTENKNFLNKDLFLWFGNEIHGLENQVLEQCSKVLHLPLKGKKESLNVASSLAAMGYLISYVKYNKI